MSMTPQEVSDEARAFERARLRALLTDEDRIYAIAEQDIRLLPETGPWLLERETRHAAIRAYRAALLAALDKEAKT